MSVDESELDPLEGHGLDVGEACSVRHSGAVGGELAPALDDLHSVGAECAAVAGACNALEVNDGAFAEPHSDAEVSRPVEMSVVNVELDPHEADGLVVGAFCGIGHSDAVDEELATVLEDSHSVLAEDAVLAGACETPEVNDTAFEELHLDAEAAEDVASTWNAFIQIAQSRDMAAEALYAAIFDASANLQVLFKTPRQFMASRIFGGISCIVACLSDPAGLKAIVETVAFQHMDIAVTIPRVAMFRDAIIEFLQEELGSRFTQRARGRWRVVLNYVGGALIYVRQTYADRLKLLAQSWAQASTDSQAPAARADQQHGGSKGDSAASADESAASDRPSAKVMAVRRRTRRKATSAGSRASGEGGLPSDGRVGLLNSGVPRTFRDMFIFNATVMGCSSSGWMQEVLLSFDTLVSNISNFHRLQEECDILSLRVARYKVQLDLGEFKIVMLSSLRSLVMDWGSAHETAWSWLWGNIERMLKVLVGKPMAQEAALARFMKALDADRRYVARQDIFNRFFALAPAGQYHFKQSTTRLHFIADKVFVLSLDIYRQPKRIVDDLSALGLRHVGYGIPTEMLGPFVTCFIQVVGTLDQDRRVVDAFSWSLDLISRVLQRVIVEGSTAVMHAINANSRKQLVRAAACAPRGKRALWMLSVQVGSQSISPLMWSIESGSFVATQAILEDLLTIRADRDRYYYGMEHLFRRHPGIIKRLSIEAPSMLPVLLDGLVWRSRTVVEGSRRVNYYIEHIVADSNGAFSQATKWLVELKDPKLSCHPVASFVTDMIWSRVALRTFLYRRAWFFLTLIVYVLAESVIHRIDVTVGPDRRFEEGPVAASHHGVAISDPSGTMTGDSNEDLLSQNSVRVRVALIASRTFVYTLSLGSMLLHHFRCFCRSFSAGAMTAIGGLKVPSYLMSWQESCSLCLTLCLVGMLCTEPLLRCAEASKDLFDARCPGADAVHPYYKPLSVLGMLMYLFMLSDLAVLSTRISAFVLVCGTVISELLLFLAACAFFVLAFASIMSTVNHGNDDFSGIPNSALNLFRISLKVMSAEKFNHLRQIPVLFVCAFFFTAITVTFLMNLLVAQLNCAYQATYNDMRGLAQLSRAMTLVDTMTAVPRSRWARFVTSLRLEQPIEFGEGDVGLAGGVQLLEPASEHVTTVDRIRRYGGTTSADAPWPRDATVEEKEGARMAQLEKYVQKAMKRLSGRVSDAKGMSQSSGDRSDGVVQLVRTSSSSTGSQGSSFGQHVNFID